MRTLLKYVLLACAIVAMPILAHAADMKIAVVSADEVLQNSDVGKRTMADLKAKVESKQQELKRQNDDLQHVGEDYQKKAVTLSPEAKSKAQADLEARQRKLMEDQQTFAQQMDQEQKRVMEPLFKVFEQVVADYAKKNSYSLILEKHTTHYIAPGVDVTADITRDFDAAAKHSK